MQASCFVQCIKTARVNRVDYRLDSALVVGRLTRTEE